MNKSKWIYLLVCGASLSLAAEVITHHPDDCRRAYERFMRSLPRHHKPAAHRDHPPTAAVVRGWHHWDATHIKTALAKIDFACTVETVPDHTSGVVPPIPVEDLAVSIQPDFLADVPADVFEPYPYGTYPPENIYGTDTGGSGGYPIVYAGFGAPPASPGVPGTPGGPTGPGTPIGPGVPPVGPLPPVPEPASLALLGTGLLGLVAIYRSRKERP